MNKPSFGISKPSLELLIPSLGINYRSAFSYYLIALWIFRFAHLLLYLYWADMEKQLKGQTDKLEQAERQREIDLRIDYFVMHGRDSIAVDMLLQLRYGDKVQARYDIRSSEYASRWGFN